MGNDYFFGLYNQLFFGVIWWRQNKIPRHTRNIFFCFQSVAISFRSLQLLLLAKSLSLRKPKRVTSPRPQSSYSSRVGALDSLVASGLTLCVTFLYQGRNSLHCSPFLDSHFLGLEMCDVNLGRHVVLDVLPVRWSSLQSNLLQSLTCEYSLKHLCPIWMQTTSCLSWRLDY